jgi:hypothetical protein
VPDLPQTETLRATSAASESPELNRGATSRFSLSRSTTRWQLQFLSAAVDKWSVQMEALNNKPATRIERYRRSAGQHDGGNHRPTAKA